MTFATLATFFEKLEATSSRLSLIEILSTLFQKAHKDEIDRIVYLTQGRLAPFFEPLEIGMAEKNIAQVIATTYGVSKEDVTKRDHTIGDMGLTAQEFAKGQEHTPRLALSERKTLSVSEVFSALTDIAKTTGSGSVEKKQSKLVELLENLDPISVKHLVRIPLGNLRLGIGDPTVLDGLATAKLGDKTKRKVLETAYNKTSDMGLIAKTLFTHGLDAVEKLDVQVGKPIRSELCERLPTPEKVVEKMGAVNAQYKMDGFRVQIHKDGETVTMYSRNLENMTHMFPELIEGTKKQVKAKTAILDTEALAYNPASEEFLPFQETTKRRRKHGIDEMAVKLPLKAFVFDMLYADGVSLLEKPLTERLEYVQKTVQGEDVLMPMPGEVVDDPKRLQLMLDDAISKGLEGVVVKRLDSPYEAGGRNFNWVKLKRHSAGELHDTIDCVILGYIYGRGKRAEFGAGALLVGVYDSETDEFVTVSKIGTGLSDDEWREIHKRADNIKVDQKPARVHAVIEPSVWIRPEIVIEVLADEITRSPIHTAGLVTNDGVKEPGYALRFPRLVSFRSHDKKAEDATTVQELITMFNDQGKK